MAKTKKNLRLALFHVNYGLRGDAADGDEAYCRDLAQTFDVPCYVRRVSAEERAERQGEGVQAWARRLRRAEFARFAAAGWIIALGHHQGDLAENVLLRMARGASPAHLLGMQTWAQPLWRPLLGVAKAELQAYLKTHGLTHREDASNDTLRYSRNVIRHQILPGLEALFPGAAARIVACADEAKALAQASSAASAAAVGASSLSQPSAAAARQELAALLQPATEQAPRSLSRRFLDQARAPARASSVPGGGRLLLSEGHLSFDRLDPEAKEARSAQHLRGLEPPLPQLLLGAGSYAFFRRAEGCYRAEVQKEHLAGADTPKQLRLRRAATGQNLCFSEMNRAFKLKDLLVLWRVPAARRAAYQLLEVDGQLSGIWQDGALYRPNSSGLQTECSHLGLNLRYLIDGVVFFRCQA